MYTVKMQIPAPIIRVPYDPPTFITFQDKKRATEAAIHARRDVYIPPDRLQRSDTANSLRRPLPKPPTRSAAPDMSISVPSINVPTVNINVPDVGYTISAPPTIAVTTFETDTAIICGGCDCPIIGRIVNANKRFHPQCFTCTTCSEPLEHVSSYEYNGQAYCHLDYHEQFAHQCYHCKTPIVDPRFITTGDRYYHEQHFFCCECGDPFLEPGAQAEETNAFTFYRGHPYCENCHLRLHKPKCHACARPIPDGALVALGKKYHSGCFRCSVSLATRSS